MSTNNQSNNNNPRPSSPPSLDDAELLHFVSRGYAFGARPLPPTIAPSSLVPFSVPTISAMKPAAFTPATAARELAAQRPLSFESEAALAARVAAKCAAASADHEEDEFDEDDDDKLCSSTSPPKQRFPCINRPVDHTYTDYAMVSDAELRGMDQGSSVLESPSLSIEKKTVMLKLKEMPCKSGGASQSFPSKLHQVLANTELVDIISWMPHGRCFIVHEPERLVQEVLPCYFNQTKILSFIRQLNLWGFKRLTRGVDGKAYYHELFLRGKPYLSLRLKRMKVKGHGYKPIPNPAGEPNFFGGYPPVMDDMTSSVASSKANPLKVRSPIGSKKQRVMSHAAGISDQQAPSFGAGHSSLFQMATTNEPTSSITQPCGSQAGAKPASMPAAQPQDPHHIVAMLRQRQAALVAGDIPASHIIADLAALANALKPAQVASPSADQLVAAQLAAIASLMPAEGRHNGDSSWGAHQQQLAGAAGLQSAGPTANNLAALLGFSSSDNNGVNLQNLALPGFQTLAAAKAKADDSYIENRLIQLQKEQQEIELLRRARLFENVNNVPSVSGLQALAQSAGLSLNHNQVQAQPVMNPFILRTAQPPSAPPSNPNQMSLSESLREAKQLEEMALAARARAQLALASAIQAQSMYSSNGQQNGDGPVNGNL